MLFLSSRPAVRTSRVRRRRPYRSIGYYEATRHPLPCLLFLLPLLLAYEVGIFWVSGADSQALRNGADSWFRWVLDAFGLRQLYWAPVLLAAWFLIGSWRYRDDRPEDLLGVGSGMVLESVLFGLGLWVLSRVLGPIVDALTPALRCELTTESPFVSVVTFVGAGIYEEMLFRLVIYSGLVGLLQMGRVPLVPAVVLGATVSATLFSAAHHIGPYGEAFDDFVFLFRALAGLYFALLYQLRGFGVVVGAHACYDVLVGSAVG